MRIFAIILFLAFCAALGAVLWHNTVELATLEKREQVKAEILYIQPDSVGQSLSTYLRDAHGHIQYIIGIVGKQGETINIICTQYKDRDYVTFTYIPNPCGD